MPCGMVSCLMHESAVGKYCKNQKSLQVFTMCILFWETCVSVHSFENNCKECKYMIQLGFIKNNCFKYGSNYLNE